MSSLKCWISLSSEWSEPFLSAATDWVSRGGVWGFLNCCLHKLECYFRLTGLSIIQANRSSTSEWPGWLVTCIAVAYDLCFVSARIKKIVTINLLSILWTSIMFRIDFLSVIWLFLSWAIFEWNTNDLRFENRAEKVRGFNKSQLPPVHHRL